MIWSNCDWPSFFSPCFFGCCCLFFSSCFLFLTTQFYLKTNSSIILYSPPPSLQLWHLLLLERPFTTDSDNPDSEPRLPGGRLGGLSDLGGLGAGPIGGSVPAGLGGPMGGLLGTGEHWGPTRLPRLHSQRRYRSRGSSRPDRSPAVEGWVTDWQLQFTHLSNHFDLFTHVVLQDCTTVSCWSFCQLRSPWFTSPLMVRMTVSASPCVMIQMLQFKILWHIQHGYKKKIIKDNTLCMSHI